MSIRELPVALFDHTVVQRRWWVLVNKALTKYVSVSWTLTFTAHRRLHNGSLPQLSLRSKSTTGSEFLINLYEYNTLAIKMMRIRELRINTGRYITEYIELACFSSSLRESFAQRNANLMNLWFFAFSSITLKLRNTEATKWNALARVFNKLVSWSNFIGTIVQRM